MAGVRNPSRETPPADRAAVLVFMLNQGTDFAVVYAGGEHRVAKCGVAIKTAFLEEHFGRTPVAKRLALLKAEGLVRKKPGSRTGGWCLTEAGLGAAEGEKAATGDGPATEKASEFDRRQIETARATVRLIHPHAACVATRVGQTGAWRHQIRTSIGLDSELLSGSLHWSAVDAWRAAALKLRGLDRWRSTCSTTATRRTTCGVPSTAATTCARSASATSTPSGSVFGVGSTPSGVRTRVARPLTVGQPHRSEVVQERMLKWFAYAHLPEKLQAVSAPFGQLAEKIAADIPAGPERTVALRKLLEAKDAAVRAALTPGG